MEIIFDEWKFERFSIGREKCFGKNKNEIKKILIENSSNKNEIFQKSYNESNDKSRGSQQGSVQNYQRGAAPHYSVPVNNVIKTNQDNMNTFNAKPNFRIIIVILIFILIYF